MSHDQSSPAPGNRSKRRLRVGQAALVVLAVGGLTCFAGFDSFIAKLGGHSALHALERPLPELQSEAAELVALALTGLDLERLADYHTHLAGLGAGSECWVNPALESWSHPKSHVRFLFYLSAAGVTELERADTQFVERLTALARNQYIPQRHVLLAFDHRYDATGQRDLARSEFYVPGDYCIDVSEAAPDVFVPAISVHPARSDALGELERAAERGVRFIKWLPNAMGIDPASENYDAFYAAVRELDMVLIVHVGEEQAVEAEADQALGNPLRLRRPLDQGVRVIAAHCASSGMGDDLDAPGQRARNFDLFLRLMDEERYRGLLFGGISTVTQINRFEEALTGLLARPELHERLVNGSDWPLPAINVLYQLDPLVRGGFLDRAHVSGLRELYQFNSLTFDFVLKRLVRHPATGTRFAPEVFHAKPGLELPRRDSAPASSAR